jgi:tRNA (mo5U34)-methyltransferase
MNLDAVRLNNVGVECHSAGRFDEADAAHKQCLALLEADGPADQRAIAQSLANRAALYRTMGEYPEAERVLQTAMRLWDRRGWPDFDAHSEMAWADVIDKNGLFRSFRLEVQRIRNGQSGDLPRALAKLGPWYHDVEMAPGVSTYPVSKQYVANRWRFMEPFVPHTLEGKSVLDIGCNGGFFSFQMKKRNAARVVGIDIMPHCLAQARFLSHWLELPLELREAGAYDVEALGRFDHVVFIGVLYHLRHPLYALEKVASICDHTLYLQSPLAGDGKDFEPADDYPQAERKVFDRPEFPKLHFIEKSFNADQSNWWIPNRSCLKAMARSVGFRKIEDTEHPELIVCRR